jgi:hypothetical protein
MLNIGNARIEGVGEQARFESRMNGILSKYSRFYRGLTN